MSKVRLTSPTFDASAQTITHASFSDVTLAGIQLIVNVTDGIIIYNFADPTKGGTLSTDTLTLNYDTTSMSDADELMVLVEDGINTIQAQGTVYTPGATTVISGVRQDAGGPPSGVADGDVHPFIFNEEGRLKTSTQPAIYTPVTGTITANGQTVAVDVSRSSNLMFHVTGTFSTVNCTFEGSIDGGSTWFAVQAVRTNANTVELVTGNLSATPAYAWEASVNALTNFRVRATAYTSGTQTWRFLPGAYATEPIPAIQAHAVTGSGNFAVTMAANATTTPAKAQDGAAGASDTGIPALMVRRDTPTALTPVAGDYAFPQISSTGEQWVRQQGELADDAAFTVGTTRVLPIGYLADETATDSVDEGDAGIARMTLNRPQIMAGNVLDDAAFDIGTEYTTPIAGVSVAMDGTDPLAVSAEGDVAALRSDPNRILLVNQTHPRFFRACVDYAAAQTNTTVVAAPGAGLSLYITDIVISNGATAGNITLLDGSGGTLLFEIYPAINGGVAHSFRNPIKLTANTLLAITSTTCTTHAITVTGYIAA
jgi:hypothetical protein